MGKLVLTTSQNYFIFEGVLEDGSATEIDYLHDSMFIHNNIVQL